MTGHVLEQELKAAGVVLRLRIVQGPRGPQLELSRLEPGASFADVLAVPVAAWPKLREAGDHLARRAAEHQLWAR